MKLQISAVLRHTRSDFNT